MCYTLFHICIHFSKYVLCMPRERHPAFIKRWCKVSLIKIKKHNSFLKIKENYKKLPTAGLLYLYAYLYAINVTWYGTLHYIRLSNGVASLIKRRGCVIENGKIANVRSVSQKIFLNFMHKKQLSVSNLLNLFIDFWI